MIFGKKRFHIVIRQRRYDLALDWMNFKFMKLYCQKQYIKYACMHTLAITLRGILCLACSILSEGKYFHRKMNPPYATVSKLSSLKRGNRAFCVPLENVFMLFCQK